jgi:hypothetical protein
MPTKRRVTEPRLSFNHLTPPARSRPASPLYCSVVDSSNLAPEQAARIVAAVRPALGYCCRLAHRMQRVGWEASDPMYVEAWRAFEALHALHVHAHYASCTPGTAGRPSEPMPDRAAPTGPPMLGNHPPAAEGQAGREKPASMPWVGKRKGKRRR